MVSYTVAAAVFVVGAAYLVGFVIEPPGSGTSDLEHLNLKSQAERALEVMLGTPGWPTDWQTSGDDVDQMERLGLIEDGSTIRVDADKFDALARGKYATSSATNGYVDYEEAKALLGIDGYEFHLRAYPLISPVGEDSYGTEDMGDYRVAYVGAIPDPLSWDEAATTEVDALDDLGLGFTPTLHSTLNPSGDVVADNSADIREFLLPNIGGHIQQTILANGAGTKYDFTRVNETAYEGLVGLAVSPSGAMALADEDDPETLGYTKGRELRAIVGKADLGGGITSGTIAWNDWVDTDGGSGAYDCGDYGYVEYSIDNGATWVALNSGPTERSQDCSSTVPLVTPRLLDQFTANSRNFNCGGACGTMLLAFHWIGDNDNDAGYGWVVDDVTLTTSAGTVTNLSKTFESPEYDMVVIGSEVDHSSFTPEDVKDAMRDYVDLHGGRLMILGGQGNIEWLDRLFDVGVSGGSGGVSVPDTTHPLLTLPNALDYTSLVEPTNVYEVTGPDAALFSTIIGDGEDAQLLAVAREGAWGSGTSEDGSVILSSYMPYQLSDDEEIRRFFANSVVYGKFHYLYLEVGPTVPEGETVASVTRTATMDMYRDNVTNYTEMGFIMYVWPGASSADADDATLEPTPPQSLVASAAADQVTLTWNAPDSWGTGADATREYEIYYGNAPDPTTVLATLDDTDPRIYVHDSVTEGSTYYYAVRAVTGDGTSAPSNEVSVTPLTAPAQPTGLTASTDQLGNVYVRWAPPTDTGGGSLVGYKLYANDTTGTLVLLAEVGNSTGYNHTVNHSETMTYQVRAVNGYGDGDLSATTTGHAVAPVPAPTLVVTQSLTPGVLSLAWVEPTSWYGQTHTAYRIYRATTEDGAYTQLAETGTSNLTFEDRGLGAAESYWYKIAAVTTLGENTLSDADGATTMDVPEAPTASGTKLLTTATITWTAPLSDAPITGYQVRQGATPEIAASDSGTLVGNYLAAVLTTTDAYDASMKYYAVRATSAVGDGAWSNADSAAS